MGSSSTDIARYRDLIEGLLPKGRLWRPREQPTFKSFLESIAVEPCRVEDRIKVLLFEADPRQTDELLEEWERLLGLPDECSHTGQTEDERRTQLFQKYTDIGGLSKIYYEGIAADLGFPTVTVRNFVNAVVGRATVGQALNNYFVNILTVGMTIGQPLQLVGWRYYWNVDMPASSVETLEVGETVGNPLREFTNPLIECTMQKRKPGHSAIFFTFS